jgi:hypothetical protein
MYFAPRGFSGWKAEQAREFEPGHLLFFRKGVVHAVPEMTELPVVFLSVDTPRRDPKAVIFVNLEEATPESFISAIPRATLSAPDRSRSAKAPPWAAGVQSEVLAFQRGISPTDRGRNTETGPRRSRTFD